MHLSNLLEEIRRRAMEDPAFRKELLFAWNGERPLVNFCRVCKEKGIEIYPMDIADADESAYAAMRRSTNGGGENSPHLTWEEDIMESFIKELGKEE